MSDWIDLKRVVRARRVCGYTCIVDYVEYLVLCATGRYLRYRESTTDECALVHLSQCLSHLANIEDLLQLQEYRAKQSELSIVHSVVDRIKMYKGGELSPAELLEFAKGWSYDTHLWLMSAPLYGGAVDLACG